MADDNEDFGEALSTEELERLCLTESLDDYGDDEEEEANVDYLLSMANEGDKEETERRLKEKEMVDQLCCQLNSKVRDESDDKVGADSVSGADEASSSVAALTTAERQKRRCIRFVAPGLKIIDEKCFLRFYRAEDLSLENHFGYDKRSDTFQAVFHSLLMSYSVSTFFRRREALKQMGLDQETIDEIYSDIFTFLLHLAPGATSALVKGPSDFAAICDYLFYAGLSSLDPLLQEMIQTALLDFLRNYDLPWRLSISHLLTALENLGADVSAARNAYYLQVLFRSRLTVLKDVKGGGKISFSPPDRSLLLDHFVDGQENRSTRHSVGNSADQLVLYRGFYHLTRNIIQGFAEKHTDFSSHIDYNWTTQLQLLHLLYLVASDQKLIWDPLIAGDLLSISHWMLDTFNNYEWMGMEQNAGFLKASRKCTPEDNACCDLAEMLGLVGTFQPRLYKTWEADALPPMVRYYPWSTKTNLQFFLFLLRYVIVVYY